MARTSRLKIAGAVVAGLAASVAAAPIVTGTEQPAPPAPDVPPVASTGGDVIDNAALGATIDAGVAPDVPKAPRAKNEPSEPRQATAADFMAQSMRNHQEYTNRAAAVAELERQLKNL